jgi:PKD repeat protein
MEVFMQFKNLVATIAALSTFAIAGPAYAGGTMTFTGASGNPNSRTEGAFRVRSLYGGGSGHLHLGSSRINIHTSCCSTPYRFEKTNGSVFTMVSINDYSASGTLTASNGTTHNLGSSSGVTTLPSGFANVTYVDWSAGGGDLDDVVWTDCTPPSAASAGGPYSVSEGSSVAVSGSGAGDPTLSYAWDLTGNSVYSNATGASTTFSAAGLDGPSSATIGIQVSSSGCAGTATATATVTVNNVAPTASASIPAGGNEGGALSFTSSATDPGPDTFTYAWNFGDGSSSTAQNPSHTYDDNGTYGVTLTVTDDNGGADTVTSTVTIANVNPSIGSISGVTNATEGDTESYSAATSDISGADTTAGFTYAWTLSEASQTNQTDTAAAPSFTFPDDGTYTLSLTIADKDGGTDTDSITIVVGNANPTASMAGPTTGDEGESLSYVGSATDPGGDTFTYAWSFGDGTNATGPNVSHTFLDEGAYVVTLTTEDDDGGIDTATQSVAISNVNPTIDTMVLPTANLNEGSPLAFTSTASDVGILDVLSYSWAFGDGTTSSSQNPVHTYADEGTGSFTVTLTVTDGDTGSATQSGTIAIANVNPVVASISGPTAGNEAQTLAWTSSATDVGINDTLTYTWDFGDGNSASGTGATHAFQQDGTYTVTFTATDNDGGADSTSITVVISNTPPSVTTLSGPATGDEGSALTFAGSATDASPIDAANLTWSWDWGDSTAVGTGNGPSHAWDDEGNYTVTATVTDTGGLTGTDTIAVAINNVAPTIVTNPPAFGDEGVLYSYSASATDPGADTITWSLSASSPVTATIDANGLVEWTPDFTETGVNTFLITADDGDGGTDVQSWTVQVGFADADNDGMADSWETGNGLDPTIDDSGLDPDGDGLTNLDEFLNGQDPNVSGLPAPPVLTDPIAGVQISDPRPFLTWDQAVDPNGDALVYDVELYEDQAMSLLVTSTVDVDALTWQTDSQLSNENADYYWRVRAYDGWGWSIWSDLEDFFLNEYNEPPGPPTALYPIDDEQIGTLTPAAEMDEGIDPDRDDVGHRVRVWNADGSELLTEGWMPPGARSVSWQVDITLEEDTWYSWDAQAEDEHGLVSDWIEPEGFFATSENAPPLDVRWLDPEDGTSVESVSPLMTYTLSSDPEGRDVDYEIDLDTATSFDSAALVSFAQELDANGVLDLATEGTELTENTWWNARVRAIDQDGGASAWDTIEFFVRGDNNPPPTPVLISPADGSVLESAAPVLAVAHVEDPEGDLVIYEVLVSRDAEGTDIVVEANGLLGAAGPEGTADQTSWRTDVNLLGEVYWTARAVDDRGAASAYADPWLLTLDSGEPDGPTVDDILTGGCAACAGEASFASADNPAGFLALALLLLVPAIRRRR